MAARYLAEHRQPPADKADNFWNKVVKSADGHWYWHFPIAKTTTFSWVEGSRPNHRTYAVNVRQAMMAFTGRSYSNPDVLYMTCGNPQCIRADHIGVRSRSTAWNSYARNYQGHWGRPRLFDFSVADYEYIWRNPDHLTNQQMAGRFGCQETLISSIICGKLRRRDIERIFGPQTEWGRFRNRAAPVLCDKL